MNKLSVNKRAAILRALTEGNSIRATARMVGVSKTTILKLLVEVGEFCATYQHHVIRDLLCTRIECDEIWSFVGAKERNATKDSQGDVWTFTGICADSMLVLSWLVGLRDATFARLFMKDVASRLRSRVQLTTDGHSMYLSAVESAFGWNGVDYAMLIKHYGKGSEADERRYSPAVCNGIKKQWVMGSPDDDLVSTSYVERQNLTMRMMARRFTRLTNAFSKKVENHDHAVALHFFNYNFCKPHGTLTKASKGVKTTPAMAAGLTDRVLTMEDLLGLMDPKRLLR